MPGVPNQGLPFGLSHYISLHLQHHLSVTESAWHVSTAGAVVSAAWGEGEQRKDRVLALPGPPCPYREGRTSALEAPQDVAWEARASVCKRLRSSCKGTQVKETVLCQSCSKPVAQTCSQQGLPLHRAALLNNERATEAVCPGA